MTSCLSVESRMSVGSQIIKVETDMCVFIVLRVEGYAKVTLKAQGQGLC